MQIANLHQQQFTLKQQIKLMQIANLQLREVQIANLHQQQFTLKQQIKLMQICNLHHEPVNSNFEIRFY